MRIDIENSFMGVPREKASNFGRMLFDLVAKADPVNKARLRFVFPKQVSAWDRFMDKGELPSMEVDSGE